MKIEYSSNNSGGGWWLKDEDWRALEAAGWTVDWYAKREGMVLGGPDKEGRWLGGLAAGASKDFPSMRDAILEFERITNQTASDEGCNCCGPPHSFSTGEGQDWQYASGDQIVAVLYDEDAPPSLREAAERLRRR